MVAARRLRKSVLNEIGQVDINMYNIDRNITSKLKQKEKNKYYNSEISYNSTNLKSKLLIKVFMCTLILFSAILCKMFFSEDIKSNYNINRIYNHYKMDFSKELFLENMEEYCKKTEYITNNIIPKKIKNIVVNKYIVSFKPYFLHFSLKDSIYSLLNKKAETDNNEGVIQTSNQEVKDEENIKEKNIDLENLENKISEEIEENGMGGGEPLNQNEKIEEAVLTDVQKIKNKNLDIILPTKGTVSSRYGERDVIFEGVNPYHTGIDIANKKGTNIVSSTKGTVSKVQYNNKYYGNFIEITIDEVTFKYAHLDKINVKLNEKIDQGSIIGLMGSTGMSTGPHLHFEIKINNVNVNPEDILKF